MQQSMIVGSPTFLAKLEDAQISYLCFRKLAYPLEVLLDVRIGDTIQPTKALEVCDGPFSVQARQMRGGERECNHPRSVSARYFVERALTPLHLTKLQAFGAASARPERIDLQRSVITASADTPLQKHRTIAIRFARIDDERLAFLEALKRKLGSHLAHTGIAGLFPIN